MSPMACPMRWFEGCMLGPLSQTCGRQGMRQPCMQALGSSKRNYLASHDLACAPVNEKFNLAKGGKDPIIKWMELKKAGKIPDREKYEGVEDKVRRTCGCRENERCR